MPAYTFHSLSDADFEELCRDLLQGDLQLKLESFTAGKDQGIDLLNASRSGDVVVQCKHYWRSGFAALKRSLRREEVPKLRRLRPQRYLLSTSVGLTPPNKRELVKLLGSFCHGTADIYGREDLNGLLRDHPNVETAHHKLWLTSGAVLQRILRNGAAVWNDMERTEIERKLALYVQTSAFDDVMEILAKFNYCIISGIPGIGKTTLAQILATRFIDKGYELVCARENVQQALDGFHAERKQVIYYDDFLGRSSFGERLGKNEDDGILRLLTAASCSKNKKVILTTREYILKEARQKFERLSGPELELAKCIIELETYTRGNRARILYNHVYFSNLPAAQVSALLAGQSYRRIIDHPNYSPRIVEWMTTGMGTAAVDPFRYAKAFVANLDNPLMIWKHAFENQISADSRCLLHVLATMSDNVAMDDLENAWGACLLPSAQRSAPGELRLRFLGALKQLDGSFISTERVESETSVEFDNPSVRDFVATRVGSDSRLAVQLLDTALYFEQIEMLMRLGQNGKLATRPSGLIRDGEELRSAIRRTIGTHSPVLEQVHVRHVGPRLIRARWSYGRRFSIIGNWAAALRRQSLIDFACAHLRELSATNVLSVTVDFVGLIESLLGSKTQKQRNLELIQDLTQRIDRSLDEASPSETWRTWGRFVVDHRDEANFGDWATLLARVRQFCEAEAESILDNAESSGDIEYCADELRGVANAWGITIKPIMEHLKNAAEERRADESPEYEPDDYERGSHQRDDVDSDQAIDRLFGSLRSVAT